MYTNIYNNSNIFSRPPRPNIMWHARTPIKEIYAATTRNFVFVLIDNA